MSLGGYRRLVSHERVDAVLRRESWLLKALILIEHRKQRRRSVRNAAEHTFEAVFEQWGAFRRLSLREGHQSTLSQIFRIFKEDVLPTLGRRFIYGINRHDLMHLLSGIEQRKALTTAGKCLRCRGESRYLRVPTA